MTVNDIIFRQLKEAMCGNIADGEKHYGFIMNTLMYYN